MRLTARNISLRYPGAESSVFDDLNFELAEPGFHAVFGPSGVGKTSLARMFIGDMTPDSGTLSSDGIDRILYCYNLERLPGWSSVGRHLERVCPPQQVERKEALVEAFGLQACMGLRFNNLSLGQRNRVNLLRYLLQDFQVLIMDESLANVDEKTRGRILVEIKALYPEVLFLYISHNVVEVSTFCRRVLVLRGGRRKPACRIIAGLDRRSDAPADRARLEPVMLEIMNAA